MKLALAIILSWFTGDMVYAEEVGNEWVKTIYVALKDPYYDKQLPGHVAYIVDEVEYSATYIESKNYFVFDSIPNKRGVIKLESKGYETQEYPFKLGLNQAQHFYLGLESIECSYTVRFGVMYPFYGEPDQYWVLVANQNRSCCDLLHFLDSMNVLYKGGGDGNYVKPPITASELSNDVCMKNLIPLKKGTSSENQIWRKKILSNPNVAEVGILTGMPKINGMFTGTIHVHLLGNMSRKDLDTLCNKLGLKVIKSHSEMEHVLELTDAAEGTINEISVKMLNEYPMYLDVNTIQFIETLVH